MAWDGRLLLFRGLSTDDEALSADTRLDSNFRGLKPRARARLPNQRAYGGLRAREILRRADEKAAQMKSANRSNRKGSGKQRTGAAGRKRLVEEREEVELEREELERERFLELERELYYQERDAGLEEEVACRAEAHSGGVFDPGDVFDAARKGSLHDLRALHERGYDVANLDRHGTTPVWIAAHQGHADAVRILHQFGASVGVPNNNGVTPALIAAYKGHARTLSVLAELDASTLDMRDKNGVTPGFIAAQRGDVELVRLLSRVGGSLETPDKRGVTPFRAAERNGHGRVVTLLRQLAAPLLLAAIEAGDPEQLKRAVRRGADVECTIVGGRGGFGTTPCWIAAQKGHVEVVRALLEAGADVNQARTDDGTTLCYIAAQTGHVEVVRALIEAGADVNQARTDNGATPCYVAAYKSRTAIVELLHLFGANIDTRNNNRQTSLWVAAEQGHYDMVRLLHKLGASVNTQDRSGRTPTNAAMTKPCHMRVVWLLRELVAVDAKKRPGDEALAATERGVAAAANASTALERLALREPKEGSVAGKAKHSSTAANKRQLGFEYGVEPRAGNAEREALIGRSESEVPTTNHRGGGGW
eukprot:CAMPEP_0119472470 /NCGR_PEP_ID=MMETSP1344-20130328/4520_1 /TAXON_ID=236787 /ORGANISM="Florenciella parvula, Strain CCMP2471" /LENGTH=590 /DNA_ID=CAMNT_0007505425 /DNA_START=117 /DNA_END=1891 /DNA_ORIENTATION=-